MVALEAVRAELMVLRPLVAKLEETEMMLASVYGAPRAEPATVTTRGPDVTLAQVRDHVVAHGPIARSHVVAALGGDPKAIGRKLRTLLDRGEIAADGRPGALKYRAPSARRTVPAAASAPAPAASSSPLERGVYPVYDALLDNGGTATTKRLAELTGLSTSMVLNRARELERLEYVKSVGSGRGRRWMAIDDAGVA